DGRGDHERPGALDGVSAAARELAAAPRTVSRLVVGRGARQQAARVAGDETRAGCGERDRCHRSAHSTRFQSSAGSDVIATAARSTIRPPNAYIPMPGSTVASWAILMSATRMPRIITSVIDHGCTDSTQRSS